MRASSSEQTGSAGTNEVMGKFDRIGWAPNRTDALHELGIDLVVWVRDERRFERGLAFGVQVKAGASWFESVEYDDRGEIAGWWFYEKDSDHFDYWLDAYLPQLIVLHDLEDDISYWVHVVPDKVVRVGKGCKILVPINQTIDAPHVEQLRTIAAQQRPAPAVEGTAFSASGQNIAPGRRLRFALIAPRLVAPHRNRGFSNPITSEEAVALLAQGRFRDLKLFSDQHDAVPDPEGDSDLRDWRWRFVRGLWRWALHDDATTLYDLHDASPNLPARAAITVVLACTLMRAERQDEAMSLLNQEISSDKLPPVDHAWLLVQRARVRADRGETEAARDDAVEAQGALKGDLDDLTASALAAAATWQVFSTAGILEGDLEQVLTAIDTAVSWWRSQTLSWALNDASTRVFRDWAEDETHRWSFQDSESANLFSAELNADLTGEHGTWKAISALAARHRLMTASLDDEETVAGGLDALRKSGDFESLKLAVKHYRQSGPIKGVAKAVNLIGDDSWTHTTAKSNFRFWRVAGDLVGSHSATVAAERCIALVRDPSILTDQLPLTFLVDLEAAEALAPLLSAAECKAHETAAQLIVERDEEVPEVMQPPIARMISALRLSCLSESTISKLWDMATASENPVTAEVLGVMAEEGDERAREELHRRSSGRDLDALAALGPITSLSETVAQELIAEFERQLTTMIQHAEAGTHSFGGSHPAHGLVIFNHWFPDVARWDPIVMFLGNPSVAGEHKLTACQAIAVLGRSFPSHVRELLSETLDGLKATRNREFLPEEKAGGLAETVGIAIGAIEGEEIDETLARLVLGTAPERREVANLLSHGYSQTMRPLLAPLAADKDGSVRIAAVKAVGQLAVTSPDKTMLALAARFARDPSVGVPGALLSSALHAKGELTTTFRDLVTDLLQHPSGIIRNAAQRLLERNADTPSGKLAVPTVEPKPQKDKSDEKEQS